MPVIAVLAVAVPLYVCATASVPIAAALVSSGLPAGAALVFLMAGPATNVATIGAIGRTLGKKALAMYLLAVVGGSVGLGLAFDFLLDASTVLPHHEHGAAAWWAIVSAIVFTALVAYFAVDELRMWIASRRVPEGPDAIEVGVEGMSCNGCVSRLQGALTKADGVDAATVTLEPPVAVVHGALDTEAVRQLVRDAGYTPVS